MAQSTIIGATDATTAAPVPAMASMCYTSSAGPGVGDNYKLFQPVDFHFPLAWGSKALPMRIVIDIRPFLSRGTGVGVLFRNLLTALGELDRDNRYLLFSSSWKQRVDGALFPGYANFEIRDHRVPVRLLNRLWHNYRFPPVEAFVGPVDIAHSPHPLLLPSRRGRRVVTIHDLHFLRRTDEVDGEIRRDYPRHVRRSVERADLVQVVSRYTRGEVEQVLGVPRERIRVVGPGVTPPGDLDGLRHRPLDGLAAGDYVGFVGTLEPRKNVEALLGAWALLTARQGSNVPSRLALAGGGRTAYVHRLKTLAGELGISDRTVFLGYVARRDIWRFYAGAAALAVTSTIEGFCIPLIEAMAADVPVVAVSATAIPEVAGEAALLVPEGDDEALAAALGSACADSEERHRLIGLGRERCRRYTWKRSAERLLSLYRELGHGPAGGDA